MDGDNSSQYLVRLPKQGLTGGVAAGFADYFSTDVTTVRLIFTIMAFASSGYAAFAYLALLVLMPVRKRPVVTNRRNLTDAHNKRRRMGVSITAIGVILMAFQSYTRGWIFFDWSLFWPLVLTMLGIFVIYEVIGSKR